MDIKANLYRNGIFIACSTLGGGTIAALNTLNVMSGAGVGFVGGLAIVGGLAVWDNRVEAPQRATPKKSRSNGFEYSRSNDTGLTISRWTSKDLWGFRPRKPEVKPLARPVELDEWQYGGYTAMGKAFIFSECELMRFLSAVERCPYIHSNLSRRYHVRRARTVRGELFEAITWFIGLTQYITGVQLFRQSRNQQYYLNVSGRRAFVLMTYVERIERQRGRGAPRMNEGLNYHFVVQ